MLYIYLYIYIYNAPFCSKNVQTRVHFRSENAALWDMGLFYSGIFLDLSIFPVPVKQP